MTKKYCERWFTINGEEVEVTLSKESGKQHKNCGYPFTVRYIDPQPYHFQQGSTPPFAGYHTGWEPGSGQSYLYPTLKSALLHRHANIVLNFKTANAELELAKRKLEAAREYLDNSPLDTESLSFKERMAVAARQADFGVWKCGKDGIISLSGFGGKKDALGNLEQISINLLENRAVVKFRPFSGSSRQRKDKKISFLTLQWELKTSLSVLSNLRKRKGGQRAVN